MCLKNKLVCSHHPLWELWSSVLNHNIFMLIEGWRRILYRANWNRPVAALMQNGTLDWTYLSVAKVVFK